MNNSEVSWWRTSVGELEVAKLLESINQEHISQGPVTAEFESRFAEALDVPYAVATTSGSVALLMALMALGVSRDDEVIVPNRTFVATAHAALFLGAKVVLVDVLPDIPVMDVSQLRQKITSRTKAIIPVSLNGRSVAMEELREISRETGIGVVEDACQAFFSRNSAGYLGTQSDIGCFSLGMTKLIATGQGGMLVTGNQEIYENLKLIRNHGVNDTFASSYQQIGFNFKFTDLQASIGLAQLANVLDRVELVKSIYTRYANAFAELELPFIEMATVNISAGETPLWAEVLCQDRDGLMEFLSSQEIQSRPFLHDLDVSPHLNNKGDFPNSRRFASQGLVRPCGPAQPLENVDRVIEALKVYDAAKRNGR